MAQQQWRLERGSLPGCPVGTVVVLERTGDVLRIAKLDGTLIRELNARQTRQSTFAGGQGLSMTNLAEALDVTFLRAGSIQGHVPTTAAASFGTGLGCAVLVGSALVTFVAFMLTASSKSCDPVAMSWNPLPALGLTLIGTLAFSRHRRADIAVPLVLGGALIGTIIAVLASSALQTFACGIG